MAIFVKVSITRRQLTTCGIAQFCVVLVIFGIIQRSVQRSEIFTDDHEWRPHLSDGSKAKARVNQSAPTARSRSLGGDQSEQAPLVTLFTTFQDANVEDAIHFNTLSNWAALKPYVLPVLFLDPADNMYRSRAKKALASGWQIRNVSKMYKGVPILKYMFMDIVEACRTPFYGYVRSDILFDDTIIEDMRLHLDYLGAYEHHGGLLLIGRRTEVSLDDLRDTSAADLESLGALARENGTVAASYLEDYLITTRVGLPWQHIPDLVVGESGYGRWLVVKAQLCNLTVIDASYTLRAIHQTVRRNGAFFDGNVWQLERCINKRLVELARFDCSKGVTECAPYVSHRDKDGVVKLYTRSGRSYRCTVDYSESCTEDLERYGIKDRLF